MDFYLATAFADLDHYLPMARAADEAGWTGMALSDHLVFPERIDSPYPYVSDGKPYWPRDAAWPDPWVTAAAMAAVTERLRFVTNVYVLPLRHPIQTAKSVATAAAISGDRISLGIGLGWMREEFEVMAVDFSGRGKRADESVEVIRLLLSGAVVEHHGESFDFEPLQLSPVPSRPVPVLVGGVSDAALRRAARIGDGWVSVAHERRELLELLAKLNRYRAEYGRGDEPFEVLAAATDVADPEGYRELGRQGVTGLVTMPWLFYGGDADSLQDRLDGIRRFADDNFNASR